jgi:hypothetical protein
MKLNSTIEDGRSPNGRFGASGAVARLKGCANLEILRPSERQWKPRLRQAAGTFGATALSARGTMRHRITVSF